jgi:hypothetical protein
MQSPKGRGTVALTFMAECFWPGVTRQKLAAAGERLEAASRAAEGGGRSRYLGSILVSTDEIALVLLEAGSFEAATALARQAAIPSERILEVDRLCAFPGGRDHPDNSPDELR